VLTDSQKWLVAAGAVIGGWLVYLLAPILTPFLAAAVLGYLGDPLVDWLERRRLPRTLGTALVLGVFIAALIILPVLLLPLVEAQVRALVGAIPEAASWVTRELGPWLESHLGVGPGFLEAERLKGLLAEHWREAGAIVTQVVAYVSRSGVALIGWLVSLLVVPVATFYLLRDWDKAVAGVRDLLPRGIEPTVSELAREADEVLGAFLKGQLLVMLSLALVYWLGLQLAGLKLAFLVGMIAGLVSFVPYLGVIVGVLMAGAAVLVQTHDAFQLVPVIGVFVVGQALEGMVLTPLLVGERVGLHPVAVIFAVMTGGQLFGFLGVLLALPVAAVLAVLVRRAHRSYKASAVYGGGGAAPPG
jgi:predicted PurR-regulated permease PerM